MSGRGAPEGTGCGPFNSQSGCGTSFREEHAAASYRQAVKGVRRILESAGIEGAEAEAFILLEHVCGFDRTRYLLYADDEIPEKERRRLTELAAKRSLHIPLQHLTGTGWFMGFPFAVNGDVLIPRPETELLVMEGERLLKEQMLKEQMLKEQMLKEQMAEGNPEIVPRVLDLCTGSGCIAVSLKKRCPSWEIEACDLSEKALAAARENACALEAPVTFFQSDLLSEAAGPYDLVVSNPPYIPTAEIDGLMEEVRRYDPRMALDGGADGLDFYRRIARDICRVLRPGGFLAVETGEGQTGAVGLMLEKDFADIRIRRDLSGKDRIVSARRKINHV